MKDTFRLEWDQFLVLNQVLANIIDDIGHGKVVLNDTLNTNFLSIMKARFRLTHDKAAFFSNPFCGFRFVTILERSDIESFVDLVLLKHNKYIKNYESQPQSRARDTAEMTAKTVTACRLYYNMLKRSLLQCSDEYIAKNAQKWFPIFHENNENNKEWILNEMIANMNTQSRFDFGIYLTKYISFDCTQTDKFPKEYFDFLKHDLEIEWDIVVSGK